ncbi:MAG TPA: hypothetical protein VNU66_13660 [Mycobacteriales bacterium]|nr:hypothetical protein [Mycobacteriales bacterium]
MHTVLSAAVLALDLARHPHGARVADVLDRALVLGAADLAELAALRDPAAPAARERLLVEAAARPTAGPVLAAVARTAAAGPLADGVAAVLGSSLLARLDAVLRLVSREVGPDDDAVLDAVAAAWTGDDGDDARLLGAPWSRTWGERPPPPPPALRRRALCDLLEAVGGAGPDHWRALDAAHERAHAGLAWSERMHAACAAVAAAGHERDTARWHLAAVRAAPADAGERVLPGAMMSVVAAVQAVCAGPRLDPEVSGALLSPLRSVLPGAC